MNDGEQDILVAPWIGWIVRVFGGRKMRFEWDSQFEGVRTLYVYLGIGNWIFTIEFDRTELAVGVRLRPSFPFVFSLNLPLVQIRLSDG